MIDPALAEALFEQGGGALRHLYGLVGQRVADDLVTLRDTLGWVREQTLGGHWVAAALDYELGGVFEPRARGAVPLPGRPLARFWAFSGCDDLAAPTAYAWLKEHATGPAGVAGMVPGVSAEAHAAAVRQIQSWIAAGDCYQVNFTFPIRFEAYGDPWTLYARLRQRQPTAHGACIRTPDTAIVSLSPELFVERRGRTLRVRPMKGTAPRGADAVADQAQQRRLAASSKDRAENVMIVDLLRNDLSRVAQRGSVRVTRLCQIEVYPYVLQMSSTIEASAATDDLFEILAALFPCGSVTGAPKIRAMQCIGMLEQSPRGLYCGSVGWFAPNGDFSLNVAIRTFELSDGGPSVLPVGSGIVADSLAAEEYCECLNKAVFLTGLPITFDLIETLRLSDGQYPRGNGHRTRWRDSATALGFAVDAATVDGALAAAAAAHPAGDWRVRLTLSAAGRVDLTVAALGPVAAPVRIGLAPVTAVAGSLFRRHKTTVRVDYDAALSGALAAGDFDALVLNDAGEVAEGLRSTVFWRPYSGASLHTPPVDRGALPGVLRAELLACGAAVEAVLTPHALLTGELFVGNALRGLLPAVLTPVARAALARVAA